MTHAKKLLCGILAMLLIVSLFGCKKNDPAEASDPAAMEVQVEKATAEPEKETVAAEKPTEKPADPTEPPTEEATEEETQAAADLKPTEAPAPKPTEASTPKPTEAPAPKPTEASTPKPTEAPAPKPTEAPAPKPTEAPATHTHSYAEKVTAPTCTAKGYTTYTCSCGDTYTEYNIEAKGHSYNEVVTAPTCTAGGYSTFTCSACGEKYTGNETPATGHSWGDWTTIKEATTEAEGEKKRTCSCGAVETAVIDKIPIETINISELISYGINYGVSAYGYVADYGCYAGYYPGYTCYFTTMEEGRARVREKIDCDTGALIAANGYIWKEMEDGTIGRARLNVGITDNGNHCYTIFMYYG